jgi:hypothetical protein
MVKFVNENTGFKIGTTRKEVQEKINKLFN